MLQIWLQTWVVINSESFQRLFPSTAWAIWSNCTQAVYCSIVIWADVLRIFLHRYYSSQFISTALHKIHLGTCGFVPMPYSETNKWSKGWEMLWALSTALVGNNLLTSSCKIANSIKKNSLDMFFCCSCQWLVKNRTLQTIKYFSTPER